MVEMFRITHSRGLVEHVEGRKAMVTKLMEMLSEEQASQSTSWGEHKTSALIERFFRSRRGAKKQFDRAPWGMIVSRFTDGEWVPVSYDFVPSHLTLDGVTYKDSDNG